MICDICGSENGTENIEQIIPGESAEIKVFICDDCGEHTYSEPMEVRR